MRRRHEGARQLFYLEGGDAALDAAVKLPAFLREEARLHRGRLKLTLAPCPPCPPAGARERCVARDSPPRRTQGKAAAAPHKIGPLLPLSLHPAGQCAS